MLEGITMGDNFSNIGAQPLGDANSETNNPEFNKEGQNVRKMISKPEQALAIAKRLEQDDSTRDIRRARVVGAYNGNAPYSEQSLRDSGQDWAFNVSFGFLEGVIGRALAPYLRFGSDVNRLMDIEGKLPEAKMDIIRQAFVEITKEWGKWIKFYTRWILELVLHGWSTAIFATDYSPFPEFVPQKDLYVPDGSFNDPNDLDVMVWRKPYLVHELYDFISDPAAAEKAGWNVENVRKGLMAARPASLTDSTSWNRWEDLEKALRDGSLGYSWATGQMGKKEIKTFHVFVPELDGRVTHWIVLNQQADGTKDCLLFKREGRWEDMRAFTVYADLEPGDGNWYGSRGLGQRAYNTHVASDRLRNEGLNQAFLGGLAGIQVKDDAKQEDAQLMVFGRFFSVPPGMEMITEKLPSLSAEFFQADALLTSTVEQRIGDVVPDSRNPVSGDKTATQARIDASRNALITEANMVRFVGPMGQLLSIMIRRLCNPMSQDRFAKKFQQRVKALGITDEELKAISGAKAFGQISEALGKLEAGIMQSFQMFRGDPDVDQKLLKESVLQTMVGDNLAGDLLISDQDQSKIIEASRKQVMEISSMETGHDIPVSPRDNHVVELNVLVPMMQAQLEQIQKGGNIPIELVDREGRHAAQHLDALRADPTQKQMIPQFEAPLRQIGQMVDRIEQARAAAQEAVARAAQANLERRDRIVRKAVERRAKAVRADEEFQARRRPATPAASARPVTIIPPRRPSPKAAR